MEGRIIIPRGLSTEGNLRFKIDWASLIVGSKFTVFALFYSVSEGNFPEDFLRYRFGGLIFGILRYQDSQSKSGPETLRTAHRIGLENNR